MITLNKGVSTPLAITIIIVLSVILIGGVLGYQYYWLPQKEKSEAPGTGILSTGTSENETTGWKTYRNEEYGFEIKYPSNKGEAEVINKYEDSYLYSDRHYRMFHVADIGRTNYLSNVRIYADKEENEKGCFSRYYYGEQFSNQININGALFQRTNEGEDAAMGGLRAANKRYATIHNDYCYVIETTIYWGDLYMIRGATGENPPTAEELKEQQREMNKERDIIEKIVFTFKFIEK